MKTATRNALGGCLSLLLIGPVPGYGQEPESREQQAPRQGQELRLPRIIQREAPERFSPPLIMERRTVAESGLIFAWRQVPGADVYQVQICSDPTFEKDCLILDQTTRDTQIPFPTAKFREHNGEKPKLPERVFWRVRSGFEEEHKLSWSSWGPIWWQQSALQAPRNLHPNMLQTETEASWSLCLPGGLGWSRVWTATSYQVQITDSDFDSPLVDRETTGTFIGIPIPLEGGTYNWRVRAKRVLGTVSTLGPWSETARIFGKLGTLPEVNLTNPPDGSPNAPRPVTLNWGEVPDAQQYEVLVDDSGTFDDPELEAWVGQPPQITSDLTDGTTYYWKVRASNQCDQGRWSNVHSFTPYCPAIFAGALIGPTNDQSVDLPVQLLWFGSSGAEKYQLQIDDDQTFNSLEIDTETPPDYPNYLADGLARGTKYYWRIRANNGCSWSNWGTPWSFTTCSAQLNVTLQSPDQDAFSGIPVTLSWAADGAASNYQVQISENDSFSTTTVDTQTTNSSYDATNLSGATRYHWRVRAHSGCDWGDWSTTSSFSTCGPDIAVTPLDPADGFTYGYPKIDPVLSWQDAPGAQSYEIEVARDSGFTQVVRRRETNEPVLTVSNLSTVTAYYWRVRAFNGCTWGNWSNPRSFVTGYLQPIPTSPDNNATGLTAPITLEWDHPETGPFVVQWYDEADPTTVFESPYDENCRFGFCSPTGLQGNTYDLTNTQPGHSYRWRVAILDTERVCTLRQSGTCFQYREQIKFYWSFWRRFTTYCPALGRPVLNLPADQATSIGALVLWDWDDSPGAQQYQIQVDDDAQFASPEIDETRSVSDMFSTALSVGTTYSWRVRALDDCGWGNWSNVRSFTP